MKAARKYTILSLTLLIAITIFLTILKRPVVAKALLFDKVRFADSGWQISINNTPCPRCNAYRIAERDDSKKWLSTHIILVPEDGLSDSMDSNLVSAFGFHEISGQPSMPSCTSDTNCIWNLSTVAFFSDQALRFSQWSDGVKGPEFQANPRKLKNCWVLDIPSEQIGRIRRSVGTLEICTMANGS